MVETSGWPDICEQSHCARLGPHWIGEYGCVSSKIYAAPMGVDIGASCPETRGPHIATCKCPRAFNPYSKTIEVSGDQYDQSN
jgi:hypothetical protein